MDNFTIVLNGRKALRKQIRKQIGEISAKVQLTEENSSILFTSTYEGEGKSTISLNLAIALSRCEKEIVWVDCNCHKRKTIYSIKDSDKGQEQKKKKKKSWGLLDYLNLSCSLDDIIYHVEEEKLSIIPIGTLVENASELFEKAAFQELLIKLRERFDYVILDSSAAGKFVDSKILASKCDSVVYVIEFNKVNRSLVKDTMDEIRKCKGKILGAVMNKSKF